MSKKHYIPKQYLGAFKAGHRQNTREFIDEELSYQLLDKIIKSKYTDTKSMEALAYITKFNNEYYKNVIKKGDTTAIHNTDKLRKDCYARENSKNRDIMSRENKYLKSLDSQTIPENPDTPTIKDGIAPQPIEASSHEDVLIEVIDATYTYRTKKQPN